MTFIRMILRSKVGLLIVAMILPISLVRGQMVGGTVVAWGDNTYGQTTIPAGLTNVVAVAAGDNFNVALKGDGTVIAWGDNALGQTNVPPNLTNVVAISACRSHVLALRNDGTMVGWGENANGQNNIPADLTNVMAIAAGSSYSVALRSNQTLLSWGDNGGSQVYSAPTYLSDVVAIAAGYYHSIAVRADGTVVAWWVAVFGAGSYPSGLTNVVSTVVGAAYSLALREDGKVLGWGALYNDYGVVPGLTNVEVLASQNATSLAIKGDGSLVAWGDNSAGQASIPPGLSNIIGVAAGASNSIAIVGNGMPFVTRQPVPQSKFSGQAASFNPGAIGQPPISYQWRLNGTNLPGATSRKLLLTNVGLASAGEYILQASNQLGVTISRAAILTVNTSAPVLLAQSALNQIALLGTNITLNVSAVGSLPMTYQWQLNGTNLSNATNASLNLASFQVPDEGLYTVIVQNPFGSTNANMSLAAGDLGGALNARSMPWWSSYNLPWYWQTAQSIYTHDGIAGARSRAPLGVPSELYSAVDGPGTLTFWWKRAGFPEDSYCFQVDGVPQACLGADIYGDSDWQQPLIYIPAGSHQLTWSFTRTSQYHNSWQAGYLDEVSFTPGATLPFFSTTPTNIAVLATGGTTFTAAATGTPPLSYQWQFNGLDMADATNSTLSLSGLQATNAGNYTVQAINPYGTNSATAALNVIPVPPKITQQPKNQRVPPGGNSLFQVAATGSTPFTYQWQFNGNNIDGATNTTLSIQGVNWTHAGTYQAIVVNSAGSTNSLPVKLTVARLIAWGDDSFGQVSIPESITNAAAVDGGTRHSVALGFDGGISSWGNNSFRQTSPPLGLSNVVQVRVGNYHNLALKDDGSVVAWGAGTNYTTSSPNYGQSMVPSNLGAVTKVAAGGYHSLVLLSNETVFAWGLNTYGQTNRPLGLSNVVDVACGGYHNLALRDSGTVVAWGAGTNNIGFAPYYGQSIVPTNLSGVVAIAAGAYHSLALKSNGSLVAWGLNQYGQSTIPAGLSNVVTIACGDYFNLALRQDGTIAVWGLSIASVPVGVSNVVEIGAGGSHCLVVMNDGRPYYIAGRNPQTCAAGASVALSSTFVGQPPLFYQWLFNGSLIDGATNSTYLLNAAATTNSGVFQCLASNNVGIAQSPAINLAVQRTAPLFSATASYLDDGFQCKLSALSGHGSLVIYSSSNLVDWMPLWTNPPVVGDLNFKDLTATNSLIRFYRAEER